MEAEEDMDFKNSEYPSYLLGLLVLLLSILASLLMVVVGLLFMVGFVVSVPMVDRWRF